MDANLYYFIVTAPEVVTSFALLPYIVTGSFDVNFVLSNIQGHLSEPYPLVFHTKSDSSPVSLNVIDESLNAIVPYWFIDSRAVVILQLLKLSFAFNPDSRNESSDSILQLLKVILVASVFQPPRSALSFKTNSQFSTVVGPLPL